LFVVPDAFENNWEFFTLDPSPPKIKIPTIFNFLSKVLFKKIEAFLLPQKVMTGKKNTSL